MVGAMDGGWAAQDGRLTTNEDLLTGFANAIGYVWSQGFSRCHPATHLRLKPRFQRVIPKYQPFRRLSLSTTNHRLSTIDPSRYWASSLRRRRPSSTDISPLSMASKIAISADLCRRWVG